MAPIEHVWDEIGRRLQTIGHHQNPDAGGSSGIRMEHTPSGILPTACEHNEETLYCLFECHGWSHTILTLTLLHIVFFLLFLLTMK